MNGTVIGLTGSTGAGKSTVSQVLAESGFGIIDADEISRAVTRKGSPVLNILADTFGRDIIGRNGELNRSLLAKRAFSDRASTDKLNSIVHPAVVDDIKRKIADFQSKNVVPVIDAPLLFEAGCDLLCNKIVAVIAPVGERCRRIMERDSLTYEAAMLRIGAQHDDSFYTERSDYVIENNSTKDELVLKTRRIVDLISEAENVEGKKE